jgi:hypothetical protein
MRASLLLTAISSLILAQSASAQVIYQSIPDLTAPTTGQTCSPCDPTQVAGAKFSLSSNATINGVQFVAGWYGWNWFGTTDVQISIYKDSPGEWGGSVGDQVYLRDFTSYTASDLDGGYHLLGFDTTGLGLGAGDYLIFFTNTSILAPATYYGVGGSDLYLWPDDDGASFTGFSYFPFSGEALGYALLGTQAASSPAVPEPASWTMMVAGFGLAGFALRRRRTQIRFV